MRAMEGKEMDPGRGLMCGQGGGEMVLGRELMCGQYGRVVMVPGRGLMCGQGGQKGWVLEGGLV